MYRKTSIVWHAESKQYDLLETEKNDVFQGLRIAAGTADSNNSWSMWTKN
jgi:hypothetical protein